MGTVIRHGEGWRAVVRKKGHPTKTRVFTRKGQARDWVTEIEAQIGRKEMPTAGVALSSLITRYLREIEPLKPSQEKHRSNYRGLAKVVEGMGLEDLNATGMLAWVQQKRSKVSRATIAMDLTMLNAVLRTAEAFWGVVPPWNEMRKGRLALRRLGLVGKSRERDRRPEGDELDRIKKAMRSTLPMSDIIDFAVETAMRSGEITRIRWEDLDEVKKTIVIRDRKHPTEKIGNDQTVPLLGEAFTIIQRQPRKGERIFPYSERSVEHAFQKARRDSRVVGLRLHDLRHHGISRLFEMGYQIQEVALVSGHVDWNQLRRYTNLKPESLHDGPVAQKKSPAKGKRGVGRSRAMRNAAGRTLTTSD